MVSAGAPPRVREAQYRGSAGVPRGFGRRAPWVCLGLPQVAPLRCQGRQRGRRGAARHSRFGGSDGRGQGAFSGWAVRCVRTGGPSCLKG